jgi:hypothetical protein
MQVRVQINEQGALRNQRYAFSDRYTLVSELMQNGSVAKFEIPRRLGILPGDIPTAKRR